MIQKEGVDPDRGFMVLQQMPGFVAVLAGPKHIFEYVNDAYIVLSGDRNFIGRTVRDAFPEVEGQGFFELLDGVYSTGEPFKAQAQPILLQTREGGQRYVDFLYHPIRDEAGAVSGIFVGGYDVTDSVRDQARLAALEELGRVLRLGDDVEALPYAAAEALGRALGVSRVGYGTIDDVAETLHVDRDWTAPGVQTLAGTVKLREYGSFIDSLRRGEFISIIDVRLDPRTSDASDALEGRSARSFVNVPVIERGRLVAVLFVNHEAVRQWRPDELALIQEFADRTRAAAERGRGEAALRESENKYRTLFEAVDAGFCVIELKYDDAGQAVDYRMLETNPAFERQTGLVDATGKWVSEIAPGLERHWFDVYGGVGLTGEPVRFENEAVPLSRWYDVHAFRIGSAEDRRVAVLFNDITERRAAEERLQGLNANLRDLVAEQVAEREQLWSLSQDMLVRADYRGMMSAVSPAWARVLGWSEHELQSRPYATFVHRDDRAPTLEVIDRMYESREPTRFQNRMKTTDGEYKWVDWIVTPETDADVFVAVGRDLSQAKAREAELEAAQAALRQSQKMEAMGQLTGGVAHDFNNLLTPIIGSLDMLQRRQIGGDREQRLIDGALQSAERAKTLVQRLLAFARRQPLQASAVDLDTLIRGMADLIRSTSGPQVAVEVHVSPDLPAARADANQLEMAVLNLAVNARDAMPGGGTITISADRAEAAGPAPADLPAGDFVRLSVTDTGVGMDEATLKRATEPFFSTKGVGKGTGLGLSMVHGLASQLGGSMVISSRSGMGTRIDLWLPVSAERAEIPSDDVGAVEAAGRTGVALLVDDEPTVRGSTADMLMDLGFEVVEAESAVQALALAQDGQHFDLLLTDHLMPGMTGTELAREVQARWPGRPVLVISGFAEGEGVDEDLPRLTKPFRQAELAQMLAEITTP